MKRAFLNTLAATTVACATFTSYGQNATREERFAPPSSDQVTREEIYWKRTSIPVPEDIVLETSGILALPGKRLLATSRRGEIWIIEGAYAANPKPKFTPFASGLHTPLGIIAAPQGGYYVAQREELTHIDDIDGDGFADSFKTVARIPIAGSYHEYAFGPVLAPNGNLRVTLNVAFGGSTQASVPWRGWMVEITPDGQFIPIAAGLRSPTGFTLTSKGIWIFAENQGEWIGSGRITQIDKGDFAGHIASLQWSRKPGSTVSLRPENIPSSGDPMHEVAKRIPGIKTPAVWLPHTIFGISTAGIQEDLTEGKFGPFAGQFFVADQGQSKIMRMSLEEIKGVWQGAAYAFREGFESGIIRLTMGEDGTLFAGQTARGWGSIGNKEQGMARLEWTGKMPFEIKEAKAQPDGFLLSFTKPVDRETAADPNNYRIGGFTYRYHSTYGSPPINHLSCPVIKAVVAEDGLSVRLAVACLREGYVHEIKASGVRSEKGNETLLHDTAYYTLNQLPFGERIIPIDADLCGIGAISAASDTTAAPSPKNQTKAPDSWNGKNAQRDITLGTLDGLKFDKTLLEAKAGERVKLTLHTGDDMLHNFVLCNPGTGQTIGTDAMQLGVSGMIMNFIPDSDDVIVHTSLVQPESSQTIYFTAPYKPGDYDYVCTFPGHAMLMKGTLRVTR